MKPVTVRRQARRLSDKILIAFHQACDQQDFEVAVRLLGVLETMTAALRLSGRPTAASGGGGRPLSRRMNGFGSFDIPTSRRADLRARRGLQKYGASRKTKRALRRPQYGGRVGPAR
jgi:hypothetical protein